MKNNFIQRAITGVLFVAILVGCILYHPFSFGALFIVISALTIREFGSLVNHIEGVSVNKNIIMLGGAYLFLAIMGFCIDASDSKIFLPYLLLLLYMMISELYLKKESPVLNWAFSMLSQLYIALPFALLSALAFHNNPEDSSVSYNRILPLSIFVFIWLSDTGAYCVGSLIGKHRLFERISPKKSWEGSIGGGMVSIASSFVFLPDYERSRMGGTRIGSSSFWYLGGSYRIIIKTPTSHQRLRVYSSWTWWYVRPV